MERKQIDVNKARTQKKKRKALIIVASLLLCVTLVFLVLLLTGKLGQTISFLGLNKNIYVQGQAATIDYQLKGKAITGSIKNTILIVDEGGLTALDEERKWKWHYPYEYENPLLITYNDMAILADLGGQDVYFFDEKGFINQLQFEEGIINVSYNQESKHLMVLHKEIGYKSCLTVYEGVKDGKALFTRKFASHYMISAAMSKDGTQVALSGFIEEAGKASAVISFLKVRDGEPYTSLIYEQKLLPYVGYLDNSVLFALSSDEIIRIVKETTASSKKDEDKILWERNNDSLGLVCANTYNRTYLITAFSEINDNYVSDKTFSIIRIFDSKGQEKLKFTIEGKAKGIETNKDSFIVFTDNNIFMYNIKGKLISDYNLISDLESVSYLNTRVLLVKGKHQMAILDMSGMQ